MTTQNNGRKQAQVTLTIGKRIGNWNDACACGFSNTDEETHQLQCIIQDLEETGDMAALLEIQGMVNNAMLAILHRKANEK